MRRLGPFVAALVLDVLGAAVVLLVAVRHWQTVYTPTGSRTDVLQVTGRSVDNASTALALVALAGVVAVLATRGWVRRGVGVIIALAGVGVLWRAVTSSGAVGTARARTLVAGAHRTVAVQGVVPRVSTHDVWPWLSGAGGALVLLAGALIAWRGHAWLVMSARYEAPVAAEQPVDEVDAEQARTRRSAALWSALDRGEDPTD